MGSISTPLGALAVQRLKDPGYHAVGTVPGLHLAVGASGSRSWILRTMVGAKRREIGLGSYPALPLAGAHEKARHFRALIADGIDPVGEKRDKRSALIASQQSSITFKVAAQKYIDSQSSAWKHPKQAAQWQGSLRDYAFPKLGAMLVRDIQLAHVLAALEPIWTTKTETASRVRGRIERILAWCQTRGYRSGINPATWRGQLDTVLPAPGKVTKELHYPAVQVDQAPSFMNALRQAEGLGAKALAFGMLTAARSGEVRGATWGEFDFERKVWIVPEGRMKAEREHRVPLSPQALALIQSLGRHPESQLVFPSNKGVMLSDMTLSAVMRRMNFCDRDGRKSVPHGLRSTFRDWAAERTKYPAEIVEAALAHGKGDKVVGAYFRSDVFEKRRGLMRDWAIYLSKVDVVGAPK